MANKKQIVDELTRTGELKTLVETYEEIAAMRMRKTRSSVLQSRKFNSGLIEVFQELKISYKKQFEQLSKDQKEASASQMKRNGKTVAVLISANTGLYGNIVNNTFTKFAEYIEKKDCDLVIIGKVGYGLFQQQFANRECTYFDFSDTNIEQQALNKIVRFIVAYQQVMVFYAQFESLTIQKPVMLDLYGQQNETSTAKVSSSTRYLFEPSLETILLFFETQIYASFFEQMMAESQLAKYASRMATLDVASENIKKYLRNLNLNATTISHREQAKKQLNRLSGMAIWMK